MVAKQEKPKSARQKIRIKLSSYDQKSVDCAAGDIVEVAKRTGATVLGPIPLPTKREIFTVLRSPHIDIESREQFERRKHQRLLDIEEPTGKTVENLKTLTLAAGVDIKIKA